MPFVIFGLVKGDGERSKEGEAPHFPPLGETLVHVGCTFNCIEAHVHVRYVC